ncbi:MAG: GAF domain-containing protein [Dehalococcoidia bacterium]|nr:GAF domain-containing protein [Dehalococcoidia bacterium]
MTTAAPLAVPLESIPSCWEGVIPAAICTVGEDGTPNVTYLSIVHRVDERHVALSRQFFKKTDENTQRNPLAQVEVIEVDTGRLFNLDLRYERTETEGPLFERMRTHLDAVALESGLANVFVLKGVDICEVTECSLVPGKPAVLSPGAPVNSPVPLAQIEAVSQHISEAEDLEELLQVFLDACRDLVHCDHAYVMLADETGDRLYTVASIGYGEAGTGSEIEVGDGLIGLAAARRQSVRVTHMARDLRYAQAARPADEARDEIPLPRLASTQSQLVTPMLSRRELVGVAVLESERIGGFQAADECLVGILANQVATAMTLLVGVESAGVGADPTAAPHEPAAVVVKYYPDDESVFLDNEYLIKGVAGGILWRLLRHYVDEGREEFSNRELRLDSSLALPDVKDNLEARLILLRKRLEERCDYLRIEKVARGRFRLEVARPISLVTGNDPGGSEVSGAEVSGVEGGSAEDRGSSG